MYCPTNPYHWVGERNESYNHLSRNCDTTISHNSALAICCWSLRTEQTTLPFYKVTDIDQTDLHRFEPSSRTLLWDEHSHSRLIAFHLEKISRHRGAKPFC